MRLLAESHKMTAPGPPNAGAGPGWRDPAGPLSSFPPAPAASVPEAFVHVLHGCALFLGQPCDMGVCLVVHGHEAHILHLDHHVLVADIEKSAHFGDDADQLPVTGQDQILDLADAGPVAASLVVVTGRIPAFVAGLAQRLDRAARDVATADEVVMGRARA